MSDARCATCKFWGFEGDNDAQSRACVLFSNNPFIMPGTTYNSMPHPLGDERFQKAKASAQPFAGADGATFDTNADFGCIQWEQR